MSLLRLARAYAGVAGQPLPGGPQTEAAGIPSAVETARMFGLDGLVALFEGR